MSGQTSLIKPTIDLEAQGKHCGFLKLPHSVHRSAYGWIPIPIVSIRNGEGPTVLLVAGNHGDEYEGQMALMDLVRTLEPDEVRGHIIVLSAVNFPAVMAGTRTSPLDEGNLNREFPGDPKGAPTRMIAHFITEVLAPRLDYSFDIHSGGTSLNYIPTLLTAPWDEPQRSAVRELVKAVGLPFSVVFKGGGGVSGGRTLASVVRAAGGIPLAVEMGGAAGVSPRSMEIARGALARYLAHVGVVPRPVQPPQTPTTFVSNGPQDYVYAMEPGLFEPVRDLGEVVKAGDLAGRIHFPDTPWKPAMDVRFDRDGTIICQRPISPCQRGDCLFQTCQPYPGALD